MAGWSIGARLTVWYSLVLLAALTLFGCGLWLVVAHSLRASLDDELAARASGVATVIQVEAAGGAAHLSEELTEYVAATPDGGLIEILDPAGNPVVLSKTVSSTPDGSSRNAFSVEATPTGRYRTFSATVVAGGAAYRILVATPLGPTETTLRRTRLLLLWTIPGVLAIASLGGYWISRRALRPVDAITRAAGSIGIENLSERLTVPRTGDELARLSETWNGMLARLESAVQRLSQFTADASHELRTPLALIRTTAELTLRRERSPEAYRKALGEIVAESERMSRLVEDLLFLARADASLPQLPLERLELTPLIRDVCEQGEVLAQNRQVEIASEIPREPVYVEANDQALRRLLLLLVDNAVKYTPAGGRITVSVDSGQSGATVAVRDTGIGIPNAALPHVFERFYRVDESRNREAGGTGLGLSIAKWIADRHSASLEAESVAGEGATFRVRFPVA